MDDSHYFDYLRSRSRLSFLYRRYLLYPRLCRHLSGHVLDVGCGVGDMLRHRADTVVVDVNPHAVQWCRSQNLDARLMSNDKLPFDDGTFQGAIMDNVLEHISEPSRLLAEVWRVLRRRGRFVVGVPGRRGFDSDPDHRVFYDEELLERTIHEAGFSSVAIFHMPVRSMWLDSRMRQYCLYAVFESL